MTKQLLFTLPVLLLIAVFFAVGQNATIPVPFPFLGTLTTGLVKVNNGTGTLTTGVANTDYLPVASPTFTGSMTGGAFSGTTLNLSGALTGTTIAGTTGTFTAGVVSVNTGYTTFWLGGVSPTVATSGTDTTGIANQQWIGPVYVPANTTVTGISYLIATGGTDKAIAALYNNVGTLLANSTTAASGTTVGSSSTMQGLAFTTPYAATGPANYWVSIQTNGTTAHIRTAPSGAFFTAVQAAGGATPLTSITVPTSFTTAQAPIASTY